MVYYKAGRSKGLGVSVKMASQIRPEFVLIGVGIILAILYLKSRTK